MNARRCRIAPLAAVLLATLATHRVQAQQVPTTLEDFFLPGSQPNGPDNPVVLDPMSGAIDGNCTQCHANFAPAYLDAEPFRHWAGSMMAQAMRDPVFLATMTIANQDAAFSGDVCLRCHSPAGWLDGRSEPTDGSSLSEPADFEGVTCTVCHRMVDPFYESGTSPARDQGILGALAANGVLPTQLGDGRFVIDPDDRTRRGPRAGISHPQGATALFSPFHSESALCATCHDVSNPVFVRRPDGSYAPGDLDAPHPTLDKRDMFPVERTYSEWLSSDFADGGVVLDGRFGGTLPDGVPIASCQDCHMPNQVGPGARTAQGVVRPDAPQHALNGGNMWVLSSIRTVDVDRDGQPDWPDAVTGLDDGIVADAHARTVQLLRDASDMSLVQDGSDLRVRITNYSGHKLPTGYPEGRRMWINVRFFDADDEVCGEHGAYDFATATLTTDDTKVYEAQLGLDATMADLTGLPEGESFHFAINNVVVKDNRIPPIGFTNAAFEAVQAAPVGAAYADGQHWDDTLYEIPACAVSAVVTLYYQSTSREYVEFLRDENRTDDLGDVVHEEWVRHGMSAPVDMDVMSLDLSPACPWDVDRDGSVGAADLSVLLASWGTDPDGPPDFNGDGVVGAADLTELLAAWGPCR